LKKEEAGKEEATRFSSFFSFFFSFFQFSFFFFSFFYSFVLLQTSTLFFFHNYLLHPFANLKTCIHQKNKKTNKQQNQQQAFLLHSSESLPSLGLRVYESPTPPRRSSSSRSEGIMPADREPSWGRQGCPEASWSPSSDSIWRVRLLQGLLQLLCRRLCRPLLDCRGQVFRACRPRDLRVPESAGVAEGLGAVRASPPLGRDGNVTEDAPCGRLLQLLGSGRDPCARRRPLF